MDITTKYHKNLIQSELSHSRDLMNKANMKKSGTPGQESAYKVSFNRNNQKSVLSTNESGNTKVLATKTQQFLIQKTMHKRLNRNQVAQRSAERPQSKSSHNNSQKSNQSPNHVQNKASRYSALYTKAQSSSQYQEPEVDPQADGQRQLHNHESSISMWTMAENLDKLKRGRAFVNGSSIKGQLLLKEDKSKN